ncbi:MAG: hypoxanthine phosphoribosyltransferase [Halanaerobiales bacterium]
MEQKNDYGKIIKSKKQIQKKVKELAAEIENDFDDEIIIISVLKSSVYFTVDLTRYLELPIKVDFLGISRLPGENNRGVVRITKDLELKIAEKQVILIDTIINTGLTHSYLLKSLKPRNPDNIHICTLIDNTKKRLVELPVSYHGFVDISDTFVVGYGLDYKEKYRNLPFIAEFSGYR